MRTTTTMVKKRGFRPKYLITSVILSCALVLTACGSGTDTGTGAADDIDADALVADTDAAATDTGETDTAGTDIADTDATGIAAVSPLDQTADIPLTVIDDNYRTYYEVFVYSFYDSDGDGIGDLQGLLSQLDYINDGDDTTDTDLGCNGLWLMPVNPSPTYHKYDVTDYYAIDPEYGTLEDFQELLDACAERGIKVIMDLVLNHTSSQHPWFQEACAYLQGLGDGEPDATECPYVEYYNFSKEYGSARYQVEGTDWYYEAQFWSEMPDLNLDCEAVREEIANITDYWLSMGVGGFRLDATQDYYTGGTQLNVDFLAWLTDTVKSQKEDAYLVGECWTNLSEYARYYASGIDSMFDFAFADKDGIISKALNNDNLTTYGSTVASLDETIGAYNPDYIDAPFYTNHDMGRSAGYYAGDTSEARTKMAGALNLFMNGSAFLYYGEEIGMKGSGADENKRAPMYWSTDDSAEGMCDGPADMDDFAMKFGSLEEQQDDPSSIYNYYKKVIRVRNENPEIARGTVEYLEEYSTDTFCVLRKTYEDSQVLLLFHVGTETEDFDVSGLTVNGTEVSPESVRSTLETGEEFIDMEGTVISMPGYSVAVLK